MARIIAPALSAQTERPRAQTTAVRVNGAPLAALTLNIGLWTAILLAWRAL
ncbi:hypothetical protein [Caulobacter hibisci]|uniref:Uncharacterized protein n=1 Tax=Caulobacter hibisci TaxID=2035993 RepID=A0ABS0SS60_9CAUL|nr:hypothetical protein [Caulobacter hibisci]MBI1682460.1 hypothetical protein [Caulobacter hibisci]